MIEPQWQREERVATRLQELERRVQDLEEWRELLISKTCGSCSGSGVVTFKLQSPLGAGVAGARICEVCQGHGRIRSDGQPIGRAPAFFG